jgi:hypothetical protein
MWVLPLGAAVVALSFAGVLARQFIERRRPHQVVWALALLQFAVASFAVFLGVLGGWTAGEFKTYWLFGAVLTVPFLAQGELSLLIRKREITSALLIVLLFGTAFALARVRTAHLDVSALASDLPSGSDAFRSDPFVVDMARFYSIAGYVVLVAGTAWSAWGMRGRSGLRDRFLGTLGVTLGATIVAAGSAFAATGNATGFSITLVAGLGVMFWGFLRTSRTPAPAAPATSGF